MLIMEIIEVPSRPAQSESLQLEAQESTLLTTSAACTPAASMQ